MKGYRALVGGLTFSKGEIYPGDKQVYANMTVLDCVVKGLGHFEEIECEEVLWFRKIIKDSLYYLVGFGEIEFSKDGLLKPGDLFYEEIKRAAGALENLKAIEIIKHLEPVKKKNDQPLICQEYREKFTEAMINWGKKLEEAATRVKPKLKPNFSSGKMDNVGPEPIIGKNSAYWKKAGYDFVNPDHYKKFSVETIDMMVKIWGKEAVALHCEMCAFKYKIRVGNKPDQPSERDLEKATWYLKKAQELRGGQ